MKTKTVLFTLVLLIFAGFMGSCTKEEKGNTSIKFQAINTGARLKTAAATGVVINTFKVNISEIEFEYWDDDDDKYPNGMPFSEIELKGPFEVDLVKNGNMQLTNLVAGFNLPETGFDEIEFEFKTSRNRASELFGKSILVKGTINGKPFEYFSTIDEFEIEIEFDEPINLAHTNGVTVIISIDLASIFDSARGGVDISNATDGNGNGIIEIHLHDNDGNRALASRLDDAIWRAIDTITDRWDD